MWDCMWDWRRGGWKRAGPEMGVFISLGMSILSLQFYRLLAGSFYFLCGPVLVKKKQAKQNVEMKMWSSSRPDLKLGDVTPNRLGLFLSLFPFFLILNFFTEWLQTFLWEKRDSVFTRRDHSGILMSQHKARVLQLPTRPLDIGKGSPFTIWMKARWGSSEDMLSLLGECGRKWSTKREKLL